MADESLVVETDRLESGLYHGEDDLHLLRGLPDECVDLVYLDPPVFSGWAHEGSWQDRADVEPDDGRWQGGVRNYLDWIAAPLEDLDRILTPTGALFLVCDESVGLYVRLLLDELFSGRDPRNRMVWWKANSGPKHHYVFYYRRSGDDATRYGRYYTVIHRQGEVDSSLVAFSFVHRGRKRYLSNQGLDFNHQIACSNPLAQT